jgi:uncharacterized membrane protein YdbT with pleckstrin-like domain
VAAVVFVVVALLLDETAIGIAAAAVIAGVTLIAGYVRRLFTKFLITSQRLRISRGIVRRNVQETRLDRVQNVNFNQGVMDRIVNVGSVDFDTAGSDDSEFRFEWVNGPEQVVHAVNEATHRTQGDARP